MKGKQQSPTQLTEEQLMQINEEWHSGWGAAYIADEMGLTTEQVLYAINLNETDSNDFTADDFR